jgi:hypothetical protein
VHEKGMAEINSTGPAGRESLMACPGLTEATRQFGETQPAIAGWRQDASNRPVP